MSDNITHAEFPGPKEYSYYMKPNGEWWTSYLADKLQVMKTGDNDDIHSMMLFFAETFPNLPVSILYSIMNNETDWCFEDGKLVVKGHFDGVY